MGETRARAASASASAACGGGGVRRPRRAASAACGVRGVRRPRRAASPACGVRSLFLNALCSLSVTGRWRTSSPALFSQEHSKTKTMSNFFRFFPVLFVGRPQSKPQVFNGNLVFRTAKITQDITFDLFISGEQNFPCSFLDRWTCIEQLYRFLRRHTGHRTSIVS